MKKLMCIFSVALALGACHSDGKILSQGQPVSEKQAVQPAWTPPPAPKKPAEGQQCLINGYDCKQVIEVLRAPKENRAALLKELGIEIAKTAVIRTGTEIYTLNNGVTITTPSSVPLGERYVVRLEDNTEFLFSKYEFK